MTSPVRLAAFYLPQFHPVEVNDRAWGEGFTEWTNVRRAQPRFRGHRQPLVPGELGYYDLRDPDVLERQVGLARAAGVSAFCIYHYWFEGFRPLGRPVDDLLARSTPDLPFFLCWANEDWTRAWDGASHERILTQTYSRGDDERHIRWLVESVFSDPRYLCVDGRPVFLVYRDRLLPESRRTLELWREHARRAGFPDLYLCHVESSAEPRAAPASLGYDAAVEFQPDAETLGRRVGSHVVQRAVRRALHPRSGRRLNSVYRYPQVVEAALGRADPGYLRYPCVTPCWDNSARRDRGARILTGATPERYGDWLRRTVDSFQPPSAEENLVFVNAWNEWAEGNHLEPDSVWGDAWLRATAAAVDGAERSRL